MPRSQRLALMLLAACGSEAHAPASFPYCGDGIPVAGEVCFTVERRTVEIPSPEVLLPGDFDGDGKREYYADDASLGGDYRILAESPGAMTTLHEGRFAGEEGLNHAVYRASARDIDLDGLTDLLPFMQYHYWSGHVESWAFGAVPLRTRPGFRFVYELLLFSGLDFGYDEPPGRFDGTFGDFDGDGLAELVFALNLHRGWVLYVEPGAEDGDLFHTEQHLDLTSFAAQDNIVTVAVDLDGNGRDDLVVADGIGRIWTLYSDPDGLLVPRTLTDAPVLPAMAGTVLAQDVDRDGNVDLVSAATKRDAGQLLPGEVVVARGDGEGGFERIASWTTSTGATQTSSPWGPQICYVHLVLLDLDGSGYPALVYALPDEHTLVVHPKVGLTLGAEPVVFPLDLEPAGVFADPREDGTVDLLVSLRRDDNGTEKDESDDRGPFIDRYRLDP